MSDTLSRPFQVLELQELQRLTLKDNRIANLSADIGKMMKLTELHLQRNNMLTIPPEIGALNSVQPRTPKTWNSVQSQAKAGIWNHTPASAKPKPNTRNPQLGAHPIPQRTTSNHLIGDGRGQPQIRSDGRIINRISAQ